ncbi:Profilin, partial [Tolypocladium ophioglossoides CBS 100239]
AGNLCAGQWSGAPSTLQRGRDGAQPISTTPTHKLSSFRLLRRRQNIHGLSCDVVSSDLDLLYSLLSLSLSCRSSSPPKHAAMSWQAYVDTSLVGTGHVDKAAIISAAGDSAWATSADFQLKPDEMKAISAIVNGDVAAKDKAFADGLYVAGSRYVMARAEDRSIYARSGRLGVAVAKTKQAIVVGHHGEAQIAGNTTSTVEGLADYLIGQGY